MSISTRSIRERALDRIEQMFLEQKKLVGADAYLFSWDVVRRYAIDDADREKQYALGMIEGTETKDRQMQQMIAVLPLTLEIHIRVPRDEDASSCWNRVLTTLQRVYRQEITTGPLRPLVQNLVETGNSVDIDNSKDKLIDAAVFLNLQYKHDINDPRSIAPGAGFPP